LIECFAYLGWIKVAETLLNPWGDDDEDFQINYLIDRNFQVQYKVRLG
jgi:bestrophin-2